MKRRSIICFSCLLFVLTLTALFLGCAAQTSAQPASEPGVQQLSATSGDMPPLFFAASSQAGRPCPETPPLLVAPPCGPDERDPLWRRYAMRGQAFADCQGSGAAFAPEPAPQPSRRSPRRSPPRKAPTQPYVTPELFPPDALCPPGCIPAPGKTQTSGMSTAPAPVFAPSAPLNAGATTAPAANSASAAPMPVHVQSGSVSAPSVVMPAPPTQGGSVHVSGSDAVGSSLPSPAALMPDASPASSSAWGNPPEAATTSSSPLPPASLEIIPAIPSAAQLGQLTAPTPAQ